MTTYEEIVTDEGRTVIKKTDDVGNVVWIPANPDNSDYQAYKATLVTESAPTA